MARALIVGCGCRGRELGERLTAEGWAVRGTSRRDEGLAAIGAAGLEPALADPQRPGTLMDLVGDVAVLHYLMGSARGAPDELEAIHGPRLASLMERLVDTPVRGFVYEAAGALDPVLLESGAAIVRAAGERWRIPFAVLGADPGEADRWTAQAMEATQRLLTRPTGSKL